MQDLFVRPTDEFTIKISVAVDNSTGAVYCDLNQESLKKSIENLVKFDECVVKDYEVKFRKPSFGDTVGLYDQIFSVTEKASLNFNPILARYKKIALLVKSWNLTEDEKFKKPSEEEILSLHPVVANAIGIQIDNETGGLLG